MSYQRIVLHRHFSFLLYSYHWSLFWRFISVHGYS